MCGHGVALPLKYLKVSHPDMPHARSGVWSFQSSYMSARRRHEIPLLRQTGMARRCLALQRFVKQGKHPECVTRVTHELQSQSSSRPALEKQHEWVLFARRRRTTKTNDKLLLFCCITVMQISLCRPRSMSEPGEKNTFPLIPPPTFDLIISALLLKNRPERRAGG